MSGKKFCSALLLICLLLNMFTGMNVFAVNGDKQISIRVEGINSTIIKTDANYRTQKTTVYEAVHELLRSKNIPIIVSDSEFGKYISSINDEREATFGGYDGWMFIVNNETSDRSIDSHKISDGDDIVVYYGEFPPGTYIPIVKLSKDTVEAGAEFTVTITSAYYDWNNGQDTIAKLKDVEIGLCDKTYYTDENGEVIITAPTVPGDYSLSISQDRADSYPLIVRTTGDITVIEVPVDDTPNDTEDIETPDGGTPEDTDVIEIPIDSALVYRKHLEKSLARIYKNTPNPTFGMGGGEWSVLSLARGEYEIFEGYYEIYCNNVISEVKRLMENPAHPGRLDRNKGTEHSRLILALTSIGKDITNVGGYDIRAALADYNYVIRQGINGPVFALIALDTHNYEILTIKGVEVQSTRDMFIDYILDKEIGKGTKNVGGWALSGTNPDPNITSMAIQGLTPYYKERQDVKGAIDRAITWLSNAQKKDGDYSGLASANSENIAQVVVALTGLGIDPHTDARFIKNGYSAIDALLAYAVPGGGFMHVKPGGNTDGGAEAGAIDGMATDQGTYALVAYDRFLTGKNSLYNMSDVELETIDTTYPEGSEENEIYLDSGFISSWALEAVERATQKGFVMGSDGKFNPKNNITRAEFTKIIVAILGLDIRAEKIITFTDVERDKWFCPYVNAAYKAGIIKGSGNKFNPDTSITREEMAAIIIRALKIKPIKSNTIIRDLDKVSSWAKTEVETAAALGLMIGDNGNFDPKVPATREMATVVAMRGFDYGNNNKIEN